MMVTPLTIWGNSQGIRINKETLKRLNFDSEEIENEEVKFEMEIKNGKLILNPIREITKLDKLFKILKKIQKIISFQLIGETQ